MSNADPSPQARPTAATAHAQRWIEADAASRRRLIVDLAMDLLRHEGLAAVTMRNVASRLGVGTMTLYTYVQGQHGLHREMVQRGFEMLHCNCEGDGTDKPAKGCGWIDGGRDYLRFAVENPGLYKLMFDHPMTEEDRDLMIGGFKPLLDSVTDDLIARGWNDTAELPREARRRAGRFWITLHGVAMLAIAGRLCVLEGGIDEVLNDLLPRVAPT